LIIASFSLHVRSVLLSVSNDAFATIDFVVMAIVFYIVVNAAGLDLGELRQAGWLFSLPNTPGGSWYKFYTYFRTSIEVISRMIVAHRI